MNDKTFKILENSIKPLELLVKLNVSKFSLDDLRIANDILELEELVINKDYSLAVQKYAYVKNLIEINPDFKNSALSYVDNLYKKLY